MSNGMQGFYGFWNDPSYYRRTSKKVGRVRISMPTLGTKLRLPRIGTVIETTKSKPFIVMDIRGNANIVSLETLLDEYCINEIEPITKEYLESISRKQKTSDGTYIRVIDAFTAYIRSYQTLYSIHIPLGYVFEGISEQGVPVIVNNPEYDHFKGDFLVCPCLDYNESIADVSKCWVVNGQDFMSLYNMKMYPNFKYNKLDIYTSANLPKF